MSEKPAAAEYLSEAHAGSDEIGKEWDQDNQQWWDWYMSLAENSEANEPLIELPAPPDATEASDEVFSAELAEPMPISPEQVGAFQRDGFIKLKQVLSPGTLAKLRSELVRLFDQAGDGVGNRFGSLEMMWQHSQIIKAFVFSPRLAQLAADLLGVAAVRLYHDNGMSKQPGCGRTPWHYDGHHFPIATDNVCTVWAPLQAIPDPMGPLGFARGLGLVEALEDIPFNKFDTSYDRQIIDRFAETSVEVDISAFDLGEVSFHHNFNFHTAGPNRTTTQRMVLATTYFEDGARVIDSPHMVNGDWRQFMPGVEPGEVIDTPLNPVLYRR
ncbi:MAG: phytanoyl-CoA dioxygenase family protein [Planctomycetota bacterium]